MKRAVEIRAMMRSNLQNELDTIEDLIVKMALVGGTSITLERLSNEAKEELEKNGYYVSEARRYNEGGFIVSWV